MKKFLLAAALIATPAAAIPPPPTPEVVMHDAGLWVNKDRMKATVEKLVSFGTRHTLSSQTDPRRGIGAALDWTDGEFRKLGLPTVRTCDIVSGKRVPTPTRVCNAVAIQRGSIRPNDVVVITGHIDSRVSDVMNATADAPGANDDGSGTAAVIEAARALAGRTFPGTIVYAALSGEEQGLLGGKILSDYARAQGWNVIVNLNNDIIGNSCGSDGMCDDKHVRVFSEGPRWQGHDALAEDIRRFGGENDSPSRNLSRFLAGIAERQPDIGITVRQIWRNDRFGRGGDHTEFLNAGFPAVRLSVAVEDYDHQHQDLRAEKGVKYGDTVDEMDFDYLAKVTRLNVAALAAIASAPPPPAPQVEGAVSTDTTLTWKSVPGVAGYRIHRRPTDAAGWTVSEVARPDCVIPTVKLPPGEAAVGTCTAVLKGVRVDDYVFGLSSLGANGFESPVASAVPGGAFEPYVEPAPKP